MTVAVYLEVGTKRVFAGAIDWPGWCRSGRTEADALASLIAYGDRYGRAVGVVDPAFASSDGTAGIEVVERLPGDATTDFGAPSQAHSADGRSLDDAGLRRQLGLLEASWMALDAAAASARGVELRRGPRGGGRELDAILEHVANAEVAYLARIGAKVPPAAPGNARDHLERERDAVREALAAAAHGLPPAMPARSGARWTPRYFVRRAAWHVLDHAWEIEDRVIR